MLLLPNDFVDRGVVVVDDDALDNRTAAVAVAMQSFHSIAVVVVLEIVIADSVVGSFVKLRCCDSMVAVVDVEITPHRVVVESRGRFVLIEDCAKSPWNWEYIRLLSQREMRESKQCQRYCCW